MFTTLVYIATFLILGVAIPLSTYPIWRNDIDPQRTSDRRHHSAVVATAKVTFALFELGKFVFGSKATATNPKLRLAAAQFVAYDVPWIAKWFMATATTDFILGLLPFETRKQRVTQWRLYLLAAYLLCHLIGLTGHLQTLYKVWSESTAGTAGRTLASSNSSSYTPTSTQSPAASAARSRLLNQTPGPNIFGMTELKTTQENEALKRELEKKAPNTGLDAMLGFGLKHGASGVVGGVERFYGTGQKLGGGDSPGLGGSGLLNRNTGSNGSSANSLGQRKELRGSYEKIDD